MSILLFTVFFGIDLLFSLWMLRWGGAEWIEYRFSAGLVFGYFAISWTAEQIKLFVFLWLVISSLVFVTGLFVPEVRQFIYY